MLCRFCAPIALMQSGSKLISRRTLSLQRLLQGQSLRRNEGL